MVTVEDLDITRDVEATRRYVLGQALAKLYLCLWEIRKEEPGDPTANAEVCCRIGFSNYIWQVRSGVIDKPKLVLKSIVQELKVAAKGVDDSVIEFLNKHFPEMNHA